MVDLAEPGRHLQHGHDAAPLGGRDFPAPNVRLLLLGGRCVLEDLSPGLPGLVLEDQPRVALRRDSLTRGQVSSRHTSTAPPSRSLARRAGRCHDQPSRLSSCHVPSTVYETWNSRPISVLIRASVHRWSAHPWASGPRSHSRSSPASRAGPSLGRPGDPFDRTPASPRSRQARRHRSTDRSLTRNAAAISLFLCPDSKRSTACKRIRSRAALSASVNPPPCAYLTPTEPPEETGGRQANSPDIILSGSVEPPLAVQR